MFYVLLQVCCQIKFVEISRTRKETRAIILFVKVLEFILLKKLCDRWGQSIIGSLRPNFLFFPPDKISLCTSCFHLIELTLYTGVCLFFFFLFRVWTFTFYPTQIVRITIYYTVSIRFYFLGLFSRRA